MTSSRTRLAAALAVTALVTGCGGPRAIPDGDGSRTPVPAARPVARPDPAVWRWESYRGIEVQVPAGWTAYGVSGRQWCAPDRSGRKSGQADGEVGRPGLLRAFACIPGRPPEAMLGRHVWFGEAFAGDEAAEGRPFSERLGGGWVRDVVVSAGVRIEVQTRDPAVRRQILGSVRRIAVDANGCPVRHRITGHPEYDASGGLPFGTPVAGLAVCRYDLTGRQAAALLGSAAKPKVVAERVLAAIERLPSGSNPELPVFRCRQEQARPDEAIVLQFATADGVREIWVGYDGCGGSGFFNGRELRGLYPAPLKLFATGAVSPVSGRYLAHFPAWTWS